MKGIPKRIDLGADSNGISIEYIKSRKSLHISGWYDHCVGIEGKEISLEDFCKQLGIKQKDLAQ